MLYRLVENRELGKAWDNPLMKRPLTDAELKAASFGDEYDTIVRDPPTVRLETLMQAIE
ncbi:hypothetical protein H257_07034 [Aphanomyces astaci]|uniref:Uncharacterized protein n=1 Tax=Aphanomyces astaci TaxID=112090 RepID=W4GJD2_APHAT|nr:hypothetical protein H257_07034 [Aphanomyces astaci]ETV79815.1 hypothetical protein H257_07034 [Aphanomyces astaci]|eukprot:XP_009830751.1 hypothetical protein H257_07034 [Aphanomyces astaci]